MVAQAAESTFEVQSWMVVASTLASFLGVVRVGIQHYYAIAEVLSIGLQTANSLGVVAIGLGTMTIEIIVDYFAKHYSNQVDYIMQDLEHYGITINYHMDLNFVKALEAHLDVGPMVGIEQ